ncbi:hypothetical protein VTP01DRAFT_981 [Rhizomucor pusillus]|uniref:uncharacterized protein n=1 Tax=Rhizomucor pusillus TaxID=4840 RepID=UPI0037440811
MKFGKSSSKETASTALLKSADMLLNMKHMSDEEDVVDVDNVLVGRKAERFFEQLSDLVVVKKRR